MAETKDDHKLVVSLEARIRAYENAINKAHKETARRMQGIEDALKGPRAEMGRLEKAGTAMAGRFNKSVATASTALSGFARGLITGGALAALTSFTGALAKARQTLGDFDAINDISRTVGLSTGMYQAIAFGALEAGIEVDKLNSALGVFAKNAGLAQSGTGSLVTELKALHPELLKAVVNATDQEERLRLVADAMTQTTDASRRAALATTLFGRSGIDLVRILDRGAVAFDEFKRRGAELGVIIPDDLLRKAGELDDQLEVLGKVIDVNLSTALVKLAPLLVGASTGAANVAQEINRLSEAVDNFRRNPDLDNFLAIFSIRLIEGGLADQFRDFVNEGLKATQRPAEEIKAEIAEIEARIADLKSPHTGTMFPELALQRETALLKKLQEELARVEATTRAAANNGGEALDRLADSAKMAMDEVSAAIAAQTAEAERYQAVMDKVAAAGLKFDGGGLSEQAAALADYIEQIRRAADATDAIALAQERLSTVATGALREIGAAVDVNSAAYARAKAEIEGLAEGLISNSMAADDVVSRLQSLQRSLKSLGVGESVIAKLITAFGALAGTILQAKSALDAYNTTQIGSGRRTVDPNTGVGVTRFGGNDGGNQEVIRSIENGVAVTRYGLGGVKSATQGVGSSVDSAGSKITDGVHQTNNNISSLNRSVLEALADLGDRFSASQSSRLPEYHSRAGLGEGIVSQYLAAHPSSAGFSLEDPLQNGGRASRISGGGGSGRYTIGTNNDWMTPDFGESNPYAPDDIGGDSGGNPETNINVSVVVEPVFEGTHVSAQSMAEIQQAAAAGVNAALREYSGR